MMRNGSKDIWVGAVKQIVSFVVGVVATAFILGSARQRVNDIVAWKTDVIPRIERMDSKGTVSFELFHQEYLRNQQRIDEKLKELEKEVRQLERTKP